MVCPPSRPQVGASYRQGHKIGGMEGRGEGPKRGLLVCVCGVLLEQSAEASYYYWPLFPEHR